MPKTNFANGSVVTSEWLNSIQNHVHDGVDADGSAPKVDFNDHINYGAHGNLAVTQDTNNLGAGDGHEITHSQTGGGAGQVARFVSDQLKSALGTLWMGARGRLEQAVNSTLDIEYTDTDGIPLVTRLIAGAFKVNNISLPAGASPVNTLCGANLVKAAGSFKITSSGTVFTAGGNNYNIASMAPNGATAGQYLIALTTNPDTHNAFSATQFRCAQITIGRDVSAPAATDINDRRFIELGDAAAGGIEVYVFDGDGDPAHFADDTILHIMVL